MKKTLSLLLCVLMILSTLTLFGCGAKEEPLKFGLGVYTNVTKATSAEGETNGQGNVAITVAAITVDAEGKVVSCALDTADITVAYTADGKAIANDSFKTKAEQGDSYGMKAYAGAAKEWYEQADAFETIAAGKTLAEIKALIAEGGKGTADVISAGCTITVGDFINAIEKAFANLNDSDATSAAAVKLGLHTEQTLTDATEEKDGKNQTETTVYAAAVGADGKIVAAASECVQVAFTFDAKGASTYDLTKAVSGKREAGDNYGMKAYGGAAKEWYEQADAFNAATLGKTAGEIASLMGADNYGSADLKSAGCTILVNGLVKAASKIG